MPETTTTTRKYTLKYIRKMLEGQHLEEERILYIYHLLNGHIDESQEYLDILHSEEDVIKNRFSQGNV